MTITKVCNRHGRIGCKCGERNPWEGSKRASRTISGSRQAKRARRVLRNHKSICHVCGEPGATIADHVVALSEGGADDESNMRPIHPSCHDTKTQAEAARGRERNAA